MNMPLYIFTTVCCVLTLIHFVIHILKIKQMSNEIQSLRFEQEKLNFRLYVTEKKQKILQEKKIS